MRRCAHRAAPALASVVGILDTGTTSAQNPDAFAAKRTPLTGLASPSPVLGASSFVLRAGSLAGTIHAVQVP
jgi:hypothetical protein